MNPQVTAEYIASQFKEMTRTTPISDISVSMICTASTINRSTFYYYFKNKDELIRWMIHHDISSRFYEASKHTWKHNVTLLLKEFYDHPSLYTEILNGPHATTLTSSLYNMTNTTNLQGMESVLQGRELDKQDRSFLSSFFAHAFTGMYTDYIRSGCTEAPEQYASRFEPVVNHGFFETVTRLSNQSE
ncbi:MAG: TetR/AcrR family transcriptional regulator C-terminal domain-containing protein [Solobacterium sp.]|nr:TetR/AcrR family transcriptional regulator C-terminal domain-containing protein [Solobacterium sp.]